MVRPERLGAAAVWNQVALILFLPWTAAGAFDDAADDKTEDEEKYEANHQRTTAATAATTTRTTSTSTLKSNGIEVVSFDGKQLSCADWVQEQAACNEGKKEKFVSNARRNPNHHGNLLIFQI